MSWSVTADPLRFAEAEQWFRNKVPITRAEWEKLSEAAKRHAFVISGVAQGDLVADAWESLAKAIEQGQDFGEWKREMGDRLEAAWGKKSASRLETIFFQNVQNSYQAGRYKQLTDPDVIKARPYWLYDAVLDSRTTKLCSTLNGTVRPAEDSFWDTHTPPLHFFCRSGLRSLTRKQAEGRITETPPELPPASGFGSRPQPDEWGRDWAKQVVKSAQQGKWEPAFLGEPPGPSDYDLPETLEQATPSATPLPSIGEVGKAHFLELLRESWGSLNIELKDPTGAGVVISEEALLGHILEKEDKRERYLSLLPDLISDPEEIWLVPLLSGRTVAFRKHYIKLYDSGKGQGLLLVAEQLKGIWTGFTFIPPRSASYLQKQRRGFLLYPKTKL